MNEFISYVRATHPELMPSFTLPTVQNDLTHGTTIMAACYDKGVVLAADRRMIGGEIRGIGKNLANKLCQIDSHAAIAYAGTMGTCMRMTKIVRISQNNFRKLNGRKLSLEGTAAHIGQLIANNLPNALQGLAFVPLLAGYDDTGVIYSYDIAGAIFENTNYATAGSGGEPAAAVLKREWQENMTAEQALHLVLDALQSASEVDQATGGIKMGRKKILPTAYTIEEKGVKKVDEDLIERLGSELCD